MIDHAAQMQWLVSDLPVVLSKFALGVGGAGLLLAAVVRWAYKGIGSL